MKTNSELKIKLRSLLHYGKREARTGMELAKVQGGL